LISTARRSEQDREECMMSDANDALEQAITEASRRHNSRELTDDEWEKRARADPQVRAAVARLLGDPAACREIVESWISHQLFCLGAPIMSLPDDEEEDAAGVPVAFRQAFAEEENDEEETE
jgi:hypothetical protein